MPETTRTDAQRAQPIEGQNPTTVSQWIGILAITGLFVWIIATQAESVLYAQLGISDLFLGLTGTPFVAVAFMATASIIASFVLAAFGTAAFILVSKVLTGVGVALGIDLKKPPTDTERRGAFFTLIPLLIGGILIQSYPFDLSVGLSLIINLIMGLYILISIHLSLVTVGLYDTMIPLRVGETH